MKPFDLQKALEGAKLVTRGGREVTHFAEIPGVVAPSSFIAVVDGEPHTYTGGGTYLPFGSAHERDLLMASEKRTTYLNIYPHGEAAGHATEERARFMARRDAVQVAVPYTYEV